MKLPLLLVLLLMLETVDAVGQTKFDRALDSIKMLIAVKDWPGAVSGVDSLQKFTLDKNNLEKLNFTAGYLYQMRSNDAKDSASERSDELKALQFYIRALQSTPKSPSINQNLGLLYTQLDQPTKAIARLREAFQSDPESQYSNYLGSLYLQTNKLDSAFYFFDATIRKDPRNSNAHEQLINLFNLGFGSQKTILNECRLLTDNGMASLASRSLVSFVNRFYRSDSTVSKQAFVWWVSLMGQRNDVGDRWSKLFPKDWTDPVYNEMVSAWNHPPSNDFSWWLRADPFSLPFGRSVNCPDLAAECLQILGHKLILEGQPTLGVKVLEESLQIAGQRANGPSAPDIYFEAAGSLGLAYVQFTSTDPDGQRFKQLETRLFIEKMGAISSNNILVAAKYHTILGLIYASKGHWGSANDPKSGIYQLEQAIRNAPESQNTTELKVLLVTGYLKNNNLEAARPMLIQAAAGYLNDDNLRSASTTLLQYDSIGGDKQGRPYGQIKQILTFRKQLFELPASSLDSVQKLMSQVDKLTEEIEGSPAYFAKIQRFKILSDIGTRAAQLSKDNATLIFHSRALQQADGIKTVGNLNDVERLNQQQKTVQNAVHFSKPPTKASIGPRTGDPSEAYRSWSVPSMGIHPSEEIQIRKDVLVGARAADILSTPEKQSDVKPEIIIDSKSNTVEIHHFNIEEAQLKKVKESVRYTNMNFKAVRQK